MMVATASHMLTQWEALMYLVMSPRWLQAQHVLSAGQISRPGEDPSAWDHRENHRLME